MREEKDRTLANNATVAGFGAIGAVAGFLLGCVIAIPLAELHLEEYLARVAVEDDASLNEARDLLGVMQHSAYPPCSEAEVSYFRDLVTRADSLKDAGRMLGGKIACSATAGLPPQPIGDFKTGPAELAGTAAYGNLVPIHDSSQKKAGIEQGGVFVLFGSHLPDVQGPLPIHAVSARTEGAWSQDSSGGAADDVTMNVARQGDMLVAERCSPVLSNCVTASVSLGEALQGEPVAVGGTSAAGGIAGVCLGIFLCAIRRRQRSLDEQLKRAVAEEKLSVVYQPIVNLADGSIVGAEALARWNGPDGEAVKPEVFIKLAEDNGFVGSITSFVVRRALKEFREVFKTIPDFRLNVNVAPADLIDPEFLPMLERSVSEAKVKPKNLVLEVTERSTASREDAMESIRNLRQMGYSIYIDDFGTGYSNLSYLLYLAVDTIKIDKAFIRAIGTESVTVGILPQIVAMARSLNLGVVVEGIESERQASYFSANNVRMYGQGWLYGRPMPANEFLQMLGLAGEPPEVNAIPDAAAVPDDWRRLRKGLPSAVAS